MVIDEKTLLDERKVLEDDFNTLNDRIKQVEKDLGTMKSNLNAVYGAVQQVDKLLGKIKPTDTEKTPMPVEKEQALNIATS
jgi:predicted nuclease with TOPRIM domain